MSKGYYKNVTLTQHKNYIKWVNFVLNDVNTYDSKETLSKVKSGDMLIFP